MMHFDMIMGPEDPERTLRGAVQDLMEVFPAADAAKIVDKIRGGQFDRLIADLPDPVAKVKQVMDDLKQ